MKAALKKAGLIILTLLLAAGVALLSQHIEREKWRGQIEQELKDSYIGTEQGVNITTLDGSILAYYGTLTGDEGGLTLADAWLVGYSLSDRYGGIYAMGEEQATAIITQLREISDTLRLTEDTDYNIKQTRQKIDDIIKEIEEAAVPPDAST